MEQIIFDVGANTGTDSIGFAEGIIGFRPGIPEFIFNGNVIVYAFEPTPSLVTLIKEKTVHLNNYHLIDKAVSDFNGTSTLNIALNDGCTSLLEFSENSKVGWPGRGNEFTVTEKIQVEVIRLDNFIQEHNIPRIDFLHIDTQGSDLNVLRGMGNYLSIVKVGVIEAAAIKDALYVNQNTQNECVEFLETNGFEILGIAGHGSGINTHNEVDIYFKRK